MDRRAQGRIYETMAAEYLEELGYELLESNVQMGHLEMDLVCRYKERLVFVEVRYRERYSRQYPVLGQQKIKNLWRFAKQYPLKRIGEEKAFIQYDIIIYYRKGGELKREHIQNARL